MYFHFLVEDNSLKVLIEQLLSTVKEEYSIEDLYFSIKSFHGIGHLPRKGSAQERKTGMMLNDLFPVMRGIGRRLQNMECAAMIIVLDNDERDPKAFLNSLKEKAVENGIDSDYEFCIAIKEMEAWILGDKAAIEKAYPGVRKSAWKDYEQDGLCDTWEVLANAVYPGGLAALKNKSENSYTYIGFMKSEWAKKIGQYMSLTENLSPSYKLFIKSIFTRTGIVCQ